MTKVDMTMFISQTVGSIDTNGQNGAIQIPAPPVGRTSFFTVSPLVDLQVEKGKRPGVILNGTSLSWAYSYNTAGWGFFSANCRIYYGYY
ncbi:hypothetical protein [Pseudomonas sp. EKM23D]|uniref:hypothetical protein n=1 Tax=Pseudomonas sp. EKM23D TaxID=2708062 RepID=UPI001FABA0FE|nr:hypothetical protein [Pseudomonas sp. EKM23D]